MKAAARHLHVVDAETGEQLEGCPNCQRKDDEISGLERDIRGWAARYAILKREKDAEARAHKLWPKAIELFDEWKARCGHPRAEWTPDRFWLVQPFLEKDGYDLCLRAVRGMAFDCFKVRRRNGSERRFDEWERIFKDRRNFEESVNKAPREWVPDA